MSSTTGNKILCPNGVLVVSNYRGLPEEPVSHGARNITKQVIMNYQDSEGHVTQVAVAEYGPGSSFQMHQHPDMDELFMVLGGSASFTADDHDGPLTLTLSEGGAIYFPRGKGHAAESKDGATVLTIGVRSRLPLAEEDLAGLPEAFAAHVRKDIDKGANLLPDSWR
jgi:quercetin dioxygenase-like cupin family protein